MFNNTKLNNHLQKKPFALTIFFVALFLLISPVQAQSASKYAETNITMNVNRVSLSEVLTLLKKQSAYDFFYDKPAASKLLVPHLKFTETPLIEVLKYMKREMPVDFQISRNEITIRIETEAEFESRIKRQQPGRLTGKILDEKGEGLPGANIKVLQTGSNAQSDVEGKYALNLPPGTYSIEVSYISFQTKRITDIIIKAGQVAPLDVMLNPSTKSLNEVVVTATYRRASLEGLYARQKNSAAVSDGITAEQIARSPDFNAAQVLGKVSGLQISNEHSVVVRGLSDRYNNVLLNGAMVPSSEPNRRDFAFDMIPSALLDNIVVNKTATPDLTGEFTGGLIQVHTKEIPDEDFFQLTLGSAYNSQATGKNFLGLDHGNKAWLSLKSDLQKSPSGMGFGEYNVLMGTLTNSTPNPQQREQLNRFLGTMPDNWQFKRYTAMPVQDYQVQGGKAISFKDNSRFGFTGALTYRNEQQTDQKNLYETYMLDYAGNLYKYITTLGASVNMGYSFGKNKISLQNTYNHKFNDDFWKYRGIDEDSGSTRVDNYNNVTIIYSLLQSQLGGEHVIGKKGIKVDWNFSGARLNRDQPYSRLLTRHNGTAADNLPPDYFTYPMGGNKVRDGSMFYSELNEQLYNWGTNVQIPFSFLNASQIFKLGYQGKYRNADFQSNLYKIGSVTANRYEGIPYEQVFNRQNFMSDLLLFPIGSSGQTITQSTSSDGYEGFQRLNAFYGMFDLKLLKKLRLITGVRAEKNEQNVFDMVWNEQSRVYEKKMIHNGQTDWLPSANAIYALSNKINVRASWYKTVARPDLRELSSFQYFDYDIFKTIAGSALKTTNIENIDLRFEVFPSPGEVLSISGFYKKFRNPIEVVIRPTSVGQTFFYTNLLGAKDIGLELDFRKSFNFISSESKLWNNLYLSGNFTWIDANIDFDPATASDENGNPVPTRRNRPLAGQSPYIVNGGLLYAGKKLGVNVTYNRFGKRIVYASPSRASDEYENPRDMVDLQLSYKILKQKAEIKFNINNLLNQEQFVYVNRFAPGNPFGYNGLDSSIQEYPGAGETIAPERLDPKGTSYSKDYDTKIRTNRYGINYSIYFTYRF